MLLCNIWVLGENCHCFGEKLRLFGEQKSKLWINCHVWDVRVMDNIFIRCSGQQPGTPLIFVRFFSFFFFILLLLLLLLLLLSVPCPLTKAPFPNSYELQTSHIVSDLLGEETVWVTSWWRHQFLSYEYSKFINSKNHNFWSTWGILTIETSSESSLKTPETPHRHNPILMLSSGSKFQNSRLKNNVNPHWYVHKHCT